MRDRQKRKEEAPHERHDFRPSFFPEFLGHVVPATPIVHGGSPTSLRQATGYQRPTFPPLLDHEGCHSFVDCGNPVHCESPGACSRPGIDSPCEQMRSSRDRPFDHCPPVPGNRVRPGRTRNCLGPPSIIVFPNGRVVFSLGKNTPRGHWARDRERAESRLLCCSRARSSSTWPQIPSAMITNSPASKYCAAPCPQCDIVSRQRPARKVAKIE